MKGHSTELSAILMPDCSIQLEWTSPAADELKQPSQVMQDEIFARFTQEPDGWLFFLGFCSEHIPLSPSLTFWRTFSTFFIRNLKLTPNLEELRVEVVISFADEKRGRLLESAPPMTGGEYLTAETLATLWEGLHETFYRKIGAHTGSVADFLREYSPDVHLAGRIYFHLVENKDHESPFAFLATYSTRLNEARESRHLPLKYALEEYKDDNEKLLRLLVTVDEAAKRSELVANLRDNGELFYPLAWSSSEAYVFLQEIPIYEEVGVLCRIPNWWKKKTAASLLVIPASLLANWAAEIENFAPKLSFFVAHPDFHKPKKVPVLPKEKLDGLDLVITTYALAQRYEWLHDYTWNYAILDEAQAIKNPGTKQTKAVKGLAADGRIVMTGTPVENRLSDLWSLFDFINPGLLGNAKEFGEFSKRLANHPDGYAGLRRVVSPFILRRLKTDKSIISDLPDKVEMKTWAAMSKKQAVLYGEVVATIRETLEHTEGIQRKGLILSALIKFKQLCGPWRLWEAVILSGKSSFLPFLGAQLIVQPFFLFSPLFTLTVYSAETWQ